MNTDLKEVEEELQKQMVVVALQEDLEGEEEEIVSWVEEVALQEVPEEEVEEEEVRQQQMEVLKWLRAQTFC